LTSVPLIVSVGEDTLNAVAGNLRPVLSTARINPGLERIVRVPSFGAAEISIRCRRLPHVVTC